MGQTPYVYQYFFEKTGSPGESPFVNAFGYDLLHFAISAALPRWLNETLETGPIITFISKIVDF